MVQRTLDLYHVTTYERAVRIMDSAGIDPAFSQGRNKWCWYVTKRKCTWAIPHVIHRHHCELDQVVILMVRAYYTDVFKANRSGVYGSKVIMYPKTMDAAEFWLSREEGRVIIMKKGKRGDHWSNRETEQ